MRDTIYRESAIDALDKEYRCTDKSDDWDGLETAMLIIENLPSAQPEPCEDAVSRQVAIDTLIKWMRPICINNLGEVVESDDMVAIRNILKSLPSVQPERKKGKWIVYYECPKCGEITKDFTEYCPFCNADMRGEQDG